MRDFAPDDYHAWWSHTQDEMPSWSGPPPRPGLRAMQTFDL
jgi:hypothetical protein